MRVWLSVPSVDTHAVPGIHVFGISEPTRCNGWSTRTRRPRQERRFLRASLRQAGRPADGYVAWASSDGSIEGLAEAIATWSDAKTTVA